MPGIYSANIKSVNCAFNTYHLVLLFSHKKIAESKLVRWLTQTGVPGTDMHVGSASNAMRLDTHIPCPTL